MSSFFCYNKAVNKLQKIKVHRKLINYDLESKK